MEGNPGEHGEAMEQRCPACGALIPVDPGFVVWCDHCNWNLQPIDPPTTRSPLGRAYAQIGRTAGRRLLEQVKRRGGSKPRMSTVRILAICCALCVHATTLALAMGGLYLLITGWPNIPIIVIALILILFAWHVSPRVSPVPKTALPRDRFPALYKLANAVAARLNAHPVDAIVVDHHFNAAFARFGVRRVLFLGLPLLAILDTDERLALIAHELAHDVNGDPARGVIVGAAVHTLTRWYDLFRPPADDRTLLYSRLGLVGYVGKLVMLCFSPVIVGAIFILSHLLWQESQQAEFYADYLAARVAGTDVVIRLLDKLHLGSKMPLAVQKAAFSHGQSAPLDEWVRYIEALPPRELERVRRQARLEQSRLNSTHPPSGDRIAFLASCPLPPQGVCISSNDLLSCERELQQLQPGVNQTLLARFRSGYIR